MKMLDEYFSANEIQLSKFHRNPNWYQSSNQHNSTAYNDSVRATIYYSRAHVRLWDSSDPL